MLNKIGYILLTLLLFQCTKQAGSNEKMSEGSEAIPALNIEVLLENKGAIKLSDITSDIEYIPLNTPDEYLIARIMTLLMTEEFIFVDPAMRIPLLRFDHEGNFLNKIGNIGRGPGEYQQIRSFSLNNRDKEIYLYLNWTHNVLSFDYEGDFQKEVLKWDKSSLKSPGNFYYSKYGQSIALPTMFTYTEPYFPEFGQVSLYDTALNCIAKVIHPFDRINSLPEEQNMHFYTGGDLSITEERSICYTPWEDTVYAISNGSITPYFLFNPGEYRIPQEIKYKDLFPGGARTRLWNEKGKYFSINKVLDSDRYIFCDVRINGVDYIIVHDKSDVSSVMQELSNEKGIINDIDGGISFKPKWVHYNGNSWIMSVSALDFKESVLPENINLDIKYPDKQKKLIELANSMDIEDNPILMIIKLNPDGVLTNK